MYFIEVFFPPPNKKIQFLNFWFYFYFCFISFLEISFTPQGSRGYDHKRGSRLRPAAADGGGAHRQDPYGSRGEEQNQSPSQERQGEETRRGWL